MRPECNNYGAFILPRLEGDQVVVAHSNNAWDMHRDAFRDASRYRISVRAVSIPGVPGAPEVVDQAPSSTASTTELAAVATIGTSPAESEEPAHTFGTVEALESIDAIPRWNDQLMLGLRLVAFALVTAVAAAADVRVHDECSTGRSGETPPSVGSPSRRGTDAASIDGRRRRSSGRARRRSGDLPLFRPNQGCRPVSSRDVSSALSLVKGYTSIHDDTKRHAANAGFRGTRGISADGAARIGGPQRARSGALWQAYGVVRVEVAGGSMRSTVETRWIARSNQAVRLAPVVSAAATR